MEIRTARPEELDAIMDIYRQAKQYMRQSGNLTQWTDGYPDRALIAQDIGLGFCHTVWDGTALIGVFCFFHGRDVEPTYARIDGAWLDGGPYGVVHRIASTGTAPGVLAACCNWCLRRCSSLRIDTHRDNLPMQRALERYGFQLCGTIVIQDGSERLAYQFLSPAAAELEKFVAYRNGKNRFAARMGMTVQSISPMGAVVVKTIGEEDLNPLGRAHGGVYFTMADTAAGSAMVSKGYAAVTMNATYNFFRSAQVGDRVTAEAAEVKSGRTICVYEVRVTDQAGHLLGTGTFTFYRLEERIELP